MPGMRGAIVQMRFVVKYIRRDSRDKEIQAATRLRDGSRALREE